MKIETEEEYRQVLATVEYLMESGADDDLLEEYAIAIEEYEDIHYPMDKPSLWARIKFRLGQRFGWLGW